MTKNARRAKEWLALAAKGRESFDQKLWAGTHYRLDSEGPFRDCLFLEQLYGPFLARRYHLGDIVPVEKAQTALKTLFETNFLVAGQGRGAVTLAKAQNALQAIPILTGEPLADERPASDPQASELQAGEVLIGCNLSFAAQLECWGLAPEADIVRRAIYKEIYQDRNLAFRTPTAIDLHRRTHRAPMNMAALAVWYAAPWPPPEPNADA